jgi:murein DD-endopeptidase MepM/ murein hydrolase activator NlpD
MQCGDQTLDKWFNLDTFDTFLNRFECDPGFTPYDTDNGSRRTVTLPIASFKPAADGGSTSRSFYDPGFLRSDKTTSRPGDPFVVKNDGRSSMAASVPKEVVNRSSDKVRKSNRTGDLDIALAHGEPVTAEQGGLVVYSSRRPSQGDGIDLNGHIVPVGDLSAYHGDVVIVQSWDQASSAVRYHLYSGLDTANVIAGDRITAGQQLGKGETSALRHELRKQTVHGPLVEVEARKGN